MTSFGFAYDGPPSKCNKGPRPGTVALSEGIMERFGCGTQGIFNCRTVRVKGAATLSFHADGRAWDAQCSGDLNEQIFQFLIDHADELGVQEVISKRRRWDSRTRQVSRYSGDDPHTEHVHAAQCLAAANTLTLAQVRAVTQHQEEWMGDPYNRDEVVKRLDEIKTTLDDVWRKSTASEERDAAIVQAIDDLDDSKPGGLSKADVKAAVVEVLTKGTG